MVLTKLDLLVILAGIRGKLMKNSFSRFCRLFFKNGIDGAVCNRQKNKQNTEFNFHKCNKYKCILISSTIELKYIETSLLLIIDGNFWTFLYRYNIHVDE